MPSYNKRVNTEQDNTITRRLIWENLLECYNLIGKMNDYLIMSKHRKFIDHVNFNYKNKYLTLNILEQYFNSNNKLLANQVLFNTLNKRNLLSVEVEV